jgi:type II secretory pathway component PulF
MQTFEYSARDLQGGLQKGVSPAPTAGALAAELRNRGLLVVRVEPAGPLAAHGSLSLDPRAWLAPASFDVEVGMQQLAAMLHSGLTLLTALRTVAEQARRPRAAAMWRDVAERIERGANLSGAMAAHPRRFNGYVIQLVRVGESSGELDQMLTRAAEHLEQSRNLRLMVMNALSYPAIVVLLAVGVSSFMVLNVIPKIQRFLSAGGHALPPITRMLLSVSDWFRDYLPHLGIGLLSLTAALWAAHRWPRSRRVLHGAWLRVPAIGPILRLAETAVFARGMGILLESGVTLLDSLRTVENLVRNAAVSDRVAAARVAVTRGDPLAGGLSGGREFLPMLWRMVAVGETTGTLGRTLSDVARFHEAQLVATIRRLSLLIEPVMIIVVGGIVGFVYIAFFVALFSLATSTH